MGKSRHIVTAVIAGAILWGVVGCAETADRVDQGNIVTATIGGDLDRRSESFAELDPGDTAIADDLVISENDLIFSEDFETGTLDKINLEAPNKSSFVIMEDFKDKNNSMLKVTLQPGDRVNNGHRAEFKVPAGEQIGDELIYKFDFMIDRQYPESKKWQSMFQLHDQPDFANGEDWASYSEHPIAPPLMVWYVDGHLRVLLNDGRPNPEPVSLEKDEWHTLVVHALYDYDGYAEVYLDGKNLTGGKRYYSVIYNDEVNYAKVGLYRNPEIPETGVMYFDNYEIYRVD